MTKKSKVNNLHNLFTKKEFDRVRRILGKKVQFLQGDIACGYGALLAGCRFFAGYPITPSNVSSILNLGCDCRVCSSGTKGEETLLSGCNSHVGGLCHHS